VPLSFGAHDGSRDLARAISEMQERLPAPLAPLARLIFNYRWSWARGGAALLREMAPTLLARSGCNPRAMVEALPPRRLEELARDAVFVARVAEAAAQLDAELARPAAAGPLDPAHPVAYLCAEFGAHCSLPLYGGGLGVLAGDVVKTASDLALPLVGMGLLYREGYFHQRLDAEGWQREYWVDVAFERLPAVRVTGADGLTPIQVTIPLRGRTVAIEVWRIDFGRVPLFLLDTDLPENDPIDRWITARLYIGDRHTRLAQYAVLGVGGVRALRAMGVEPGLFHLNEGHAALGVFERCRELTAAGVALDEALARVRARTVFTTHTPVAAGNEGYDRGEVEPVLEGLRQEMDVPAATFHGLGTWPGSGDSVAITPLALRTSRAANGVSRRHGEVARAMWSGLWHGRAPAEVPITHVTNGVHVATWMSEPMQALLEQHLAPDWRDRLGEAALWERMADVPDEALWQVRCALRAKLVEQARERSVFDRLRRGEDPDYVEAAERVFDAQHFTIGFARRVATYKRLYLLTRRFDTALRLLADPARPLQLVIAGKAHPADREAKETLQALLRARPLPNVGSHVVFLEDYDLHLAPRVVSGVDLWLNLPRPPLEASGTSGMKVVLNGGLHLSVLDGWWVEAYDPACGWAIASPEADPATQDEHDASVLYDLVEHEIVPLFYERDANGIPRRWLARVKASMARYVPRFASERMLREYVEALYTPPAASG
jgi:starch phosphorylase